MADMETTEPAEADASSSSEVPVLPPISNTPLCTQTATAPAVRSTTPKIKRRTRSSSPKLTAGAVHPFRTLNEAKLPSVYEMFPAPLHADVAIPKRVNVLRPPPGGNYSSFMETTENHWRNSSRSMLMQQREHFRYHNGWRPYYYGAPAEKELHNKLIREGLKQQMSDAWRNQKTTFNARVQESVDAVARDRSDLQADTDKHLRYKETMHAYCVANKQTMEAKEHITRLNKLNDLANEREQIRYNPINWSCSLK